MLLCFSDCCLGISVCESEWAEGTFESVKRFDCDEEFVEWEGCHEGFWPTDGYKNPTVSGVFANGIDPRCSICLSGLIHARFLVSSGGNRPDSLATNGLIDCTVGL